MGAERVGADRGPDPGDEILDRITVEYLEARLAGKSPSKEEILARHPQLAGELAEFFASVDQFGAAAAATDQLGRLPALMELPRPFGGHDLIEEIGRGGMGVVYRALQRDLGRTVAVKIILAGGFASADDVERFRREARAAAALDHPHIVPVFEVGACEGLHFFSMKLMEGGSLAQAAGAASSAPPREARQAAALVLKVAGAVDHAHRRGVLHRDLKPSNILLDTAGEPHLSDFGLARLRDGAPSLTRSGAVLGTPAYMSPEQAAGRVDSIGPAADIYSLGAILYELLTGRAPFRGESAIETLRRVAEDEPRRPRAIDRRIPPDLESICLKCMEKDPRHRYATAGEMARDLERFLAGEPVEARRAGTAERSWRWCRRHPAPTTIGVLLLILAVGATVAASWVEILRRKGRDDLWTSYLAQARAFRRSDDPESRMRGLAAVGEAARIRTAPELRDEAIALMARVGIRLERQREAPAGSFRPALDPRMEVLAAADPQGNISVWRIGGGSEPPRVLGSGAKTEHIRLLFSPSARFLAAVYPSSAGQVKVVAWSVEKGTEILNAAATRGSLRDAVAFHPDGRRIFLPVPDGTAELRDLDDGTQTPLDFADRAPAEAAAFSPDGGKLACAFLDGTVRILDLATGGSFAFPAASRAHHLAWHPGGRVLAAAGTDFRVRTWLLDGDGARQLLTFHPGYDTTVGSASFNPAGDLLVSTGWDERLHLWDSATARELLHIPGPSGADIQWVAGGERMVCTITFPGSSRFQEWKVETGEELRTYGGGPSFDLGLDHRLLVSGNSSSSWFLDPPSGGWVLSVAVPYQGALFDPGGRFLLSKTAQGLFSTPIERFRRDGGEMIHLGPAERIVDGRIPLLDFSLSADGSRLALALGNHTAVVVDPRRPHAILRCVEHSRLNGAALSPGGERVATATWHGYGVKVWDVASGEILHEEPGRSAVAAFSPDDRWLAVSTGVDFHLLDAGAASLREAKRPLWTIARADPGLSPAAMAFNSASSLVALSTTRQSVQLVEPRSGRILATLGGRTDEFIRHVRFSADGGELWVGRDSGIERWDLRRLRSRLEAFGLDWDQPPLPAPSGGTDELPLRVVLGPGALPKETELPPPAITTEALRKAAKEARAAR